jgi:thioredoxin-related protein
MQEVSMKRFVLSLVLVLLSGSALPAYSGEIPFIKEDWEKARARAAAENKMLLVDFYTDWCSWCKVMDTTTFRDPAVSAFINENFVPLSIDAEKGLGVTVAIKYRVNAYPSYGFFSPDGRLVMKFLGYAPAEDFLKTLADAVAKHKAGEYYEGVTPGIDLPYPEFLVLASGSKGERKMPEPGVVNAYLDAQADLFDEVNFTVLCRFKTTAKVSEFFLANRERYEKLYGKDDVEMKTSSIISAQLADAIKANDKDLLAKTLEMSDKYNSGDREENRERLTMSFYRGTKEWKTYAGMVDAGIKSGKVQDPSVNAAAWTIYEQCDDKAVITMAVGWMAKTVEASPTYAYLDTYAALLQKDGQAKLAEEYALKAIEKGKADKEDVSSTEDLLKKIRGQVQ